MNFTTTHIRSEKVTVDTRIYTVLEGGKKSGKVYLAAIAPDMELTVITLDEAPGILPCFDESDAYLSVLDTSLLLSYNPAQVLKFAGKQYLTGAVILLRANMDGNFISLTIDEIYRFQKYLESHSVTLMVDNQKLTCISIGRNGKDKPHWIKRTLPLPPQESRPDRPSLKPTRRSYDKQSAPPCPLPFPLRTFPGNCYSKA